MLVAVLSVVVGLVVFGFLLTFEEPVSLVFCAFAASFRLGAFAGTRGPSRTLRLSAGGLVFTLRQVLTCPWQRAEQVLPVFLQLQRDVSQPLEQLQRLAIEDGIGDATGDVILNYTK